MSIMEFPKIQDICKRLKRNDPELTHLFLCLEEPLGDADAVAIAAVLANNTTVVTLNLYCDIGTNGSFAFVSALLQNTFVEQLKMVSLNPMKEEAVAAWSELLSRTQTLKSVYFLCREISDSQAELLVHALQNNRSVREFALTGNGVGDGGATACGRLLESNQTLKELLYSGERLSCKGSDAIAAALLQNKSLERLTIRSENIRRKNCKAMIEYLQDNMTLQYLESTMNLPLLCHFYLELNRNGRRLLKEKHAHPGLWAYMLEKVGRTHYELHFLDPSRRYFAPSKVFYVLCQNPELCSYVCKERRSTSSDSLD